MFDLAKHLSFCLRLANIKIKTGSWLVAHLIRKSLVQVAAWWWQWCTWDVDMDVDVDVDVEWMLDG